MVGCPNRCPVRQNVCKSAPGSTCATRQAQPQECDRYYERGADLRPAPSGDAISHHHRPRADHPGRVSGGGVPKPVPRTPKCLQISPWQYVCNRRRNAIGIMRGGATCGRPRQGTPSATTTDPGRTVRHLCVENLTNCLSKTNYKVSRADSLAYCLSKSNLIVKVFSCTLKQIGREFAGRT